MIRECCQDIALYVPAWEEWIVDLRFVDIVEADAGVTRQLLEVFEAYTLQLGLPEALDIDLAYLQISWKHNITKILAPYHK